MSMAQDFKETANARVEQESELAIALLMQLLFDGNQAEPSAQIVVKTTGER